MNIDADKLSENRTYPLKNRSILKSKKKICTCITYIKIALKIVVNVFKNYLNFKFLSLKKITEIRTVQFYENKNIFSDKYLGVVFTVVTVLAVD